MILITGAAGKTGQAIISELVAKEAPVRALVYRREQMDVVNALGVRDVNVGDMADPSVLEKSMMGVRSIYLICPNMNQSELAIGKLAIELAIQNGIQHFVYHSVLHPQTKRMSHHWYKLEVEEAIFESGLDFTILQPAAYMQNILTGWDIIIDAGIYEVPYPPETRLNIVDLSDVAETAATVLVDSGHRGAIYELAGPDSLSQMEIALILSDKLNQPIHARQIPISKWKTRAESRGMGPYQIDTLISMFRYYEAYGFIGNPNVLQWLLGRSPSKFSEFAERISQQY